MHFPSFLYCPIFFIEFPPSLSEIFLGISDIACLATVVSCRAMMLSLSFFSCELFFLAVLVRLLAMCLFFLCFVIGKSVCCCRRDSNIWVGLFVWVLTVCASFLSRTGSIVRVSAAQLATLSSHYSERVRGVSTCSEETAEVWRVCPPLFSTSIVLCDGFKCVVSTAHRVLSTAHPCVSLCEWLGYYGLDRCWIFRASERGQVSLPRVFPCCCYYYYYFFFIVGTCTSCPLVRSDRLDINGYFAIIRFWSCCSWGV